MPKKRFENPRVRHINLPDGYVQYLVDGPMFYPVPDASPEDREPTSDAHVRFLEVLLPAFIEQPVVSATVFVGMSQEHGLLHGQQNGAGLVFLLQSILIKPADGQTRIVATAIWDKCHKAITIEDERWLSRWEVNCHLIVVGKPNPAATTQGRNWEDNNDGRRPPSRASEVANYAES